MDSWTFVLWTFLERIRKLTHLDILEGGLKEARVLRTRQEPAEATREQLILWIQGSRFPSQMKLSLCCFRIPETEKLDHISTCTILLGVEIHTTLLEINSANTYQIFTAFDLVILLLAEHSKQLVFNIKKSVTKIGIKVLWIRAPN